MLMQTGLWAEAIMSLLRGKFLLPDRCNGLAGRARSVWATRCPSGTRVDRAALQTWVAAGSPVTFPYLRGFSCICRFSRSEKQPLLPTGSSLSLSIRSSAHGELSFSY